MFSPMYWCLPKPFRPKWSSRIFLQLRRWMWTLWFVWSCYQGSSRMCHLLFRWKVCLYGNLWKGQGCLHLLWSPINHSFRKLKIKQFEEKKTFVLQGDPNQNFRLQMTVALSVCISDPMLVKPKWVWEAIFFYEFQLIIYTYKLFMLKMMTFYIKHHGVMDKALDCHA